MKQEPLLRLTSTFESMRHVFILEEDFTHDLKPSITVPKGFATDLGSIPRVMWSIVSPSEIARSAIVHDYLTTGADGVRHTDTPRIEADRFLRDAVREEVGYKTSLLVYAAVRSYAIVARKK